MNTSDIAVSFLSSIGYLAPGTCALVYAVMGLWPIVMHGCVTWTAALYSSMLVIYNVLSNVTNHLNHKLGEEMQKENVQ